MAGRKGEKIWADAVRRAVHRRLEAEEGKPQKIERLADRLVESGLAGDTTALKEIGDRLDGKPRQIVEGAGDNGEHLLIKRIERVIVKATDPDT
jgi:hypothetical protein